MTLRRNWSHTTIALSVAAVILSITPPTHAQCPAGTTNPAELLFGTWTFDMRGEVGAILSFASAGQFTAALQTLSGGGQIAGLTITRSTSTGVSLEVISGRYQIFSDCSGGTLTFNTFSGPSQFDFWFDEFFSEIRFVSTNNDVAVKGTAEMF